MLLHCICKPGNEAEPPSSRTTPLLIQLKMPLCPHGKKIDFFILPYSCTFVCGIFCIHSPQTAIIPYCIYASSQHEHQGCPLTELITHKGLCQCLHFAFIFPLQSAVNADEERLITAVYNTLQLPYVFLFLENSQVLFCHLNECTFLDVVSYTERYMNKSMVGCKFLQTNS